MKKSATTALAVALVLGTCALSQAGNNFFPRQEKTADKDAQAPLKTLKGTVKAEGDKVTFVSDKNNKSWDVVNPEALKGHEGHHVEVKAHVYADKNAIHVMEVKMASQKEEVPERPY